MELRFVRCVNRVQISIQRATPFVYIKPTSEIITAKIVYRKLQKKRIEDLQYSNEYFAQLHCVVETAENEQNDEPPEDLLEKIPKLLGSKMLVFTFPVMWIGCRDLVETLLEGMRSVRFMEDSSALDNFLSTYSPFLINAPLQPLLSQ